MNRRQFLKQSAAAGAGFWIAGRQLGYGQEKSPNAKLNLGVVGCGGMRGEANTGGCSGESIVALCDVDERNLAKAAKKYPDAPQYHDFREMLEKEKKLDGVIISTPDHMHAPVGVMAMKLGKHVYCEKPLAHSVFEVRTMIETAAKYKLFTQMGTQIHAENNYRRVVELVQAGAIGKISEVQVWVGGAWTANELPGDEGPVPKYLHWDLWLGPATERPYSGKYHPTNWRSFWNFGGGHLADMGCHYIDLAFWALKLRHPMTAEVEGPPVHEHGAPPWLITTWTFPERDGLAPVKLTWHHGDKRPALLKEGKLGKWDGNGVLFIGEKGMLLSDYGKHKLLPEDEFKDYKRPEQTIPASIGHHKEWTESIKTQKPSLCNFDYSGTLAECVLLGNVAYRVGKKLEWDSAALKAKNCPEADRFIRREYRKGWTL
jgi:predicted dehydrogenase